MKSSDHGPFYFPGCRGKKSNVLESILRYVISVVFRDLNKAEILTLYLSHFQKRTGQLELVFFVSLDGCQVIGLYFA